MFVIYSYNLLFVLLTSQVSLCSRRITGGRDVTKNKNYAVYFVKAPKSEQQYTGWTCSGAIVTEWFIITAASCVEDVDYMYAIAGYDKFVSDEDIDNDACTRSKKKKVVLTCVPKDYSFSYEKADWARNDIAVVKVESPYNFEDASYADICSYTPGPIIINYEPRYQQPGLDAMTMGWGHNQTWRKITEKSSQNSPKLQYAPTRILNKNICKTYYAHEDGMDKIIDEQMICTLDAGNIDDAGELIKMTRPDAEGCLSMLRMGMPASSCNLTSSEIISLRSRADADEATVLSHRRHASGDEKMKQKNGSSLKHQREDKWRQLWSEYSPNEKLEDNLRDTGQNTETLANTPKEVGETTTDGLSSETPEIVILNLYKNTDPKGSIMEVKRTPGLCQNDHGAPLVSWVGRNEVLLGIGSAFLIDDNLHCVGPYLFTSTQCNGAFLECVLDMYSNDTNTLRNCKEMLKHDGIDLVERRLSWVDHPAGPADNEVAIPQVLQRTQGTQENLHHEHHFLPFI